MARKCIFCGSRRNLNLEHAWPRWLGNIIGGEGLFTFRRKVGDQVHTWSKDELDVRTRRVCYDCNNGWMHDLEDDIKPLLSRMILGDLPVTLDRDAQDLLCLWIAKTGMVLEFVHGKPRHVPSEHHHWVYARREPPPQSFIRLGGYALEVPHGGEFSPLHSHPHPLTFQIRNGGGIETIPAYTLTMRAGYLVMQIFGYEFRGHDSVITLNPDTRLAFLVLWPRRSDSVVWPKGPQPWPFLDDEGFDLFATDFTREAKPPPPST